MRDSRDQERQEGEQLYTFGLRYEDSLEELDIWARSEAQARALATELAEADYEPGYTEMVALDPGGSAGLITF